MRFRPTYANVASTLALVVALSGTAYAAATITGAQVKNESLTGRDVRDGSLTGRDVTNNSITSSDVRELTKQDLRPGVLPTPGPGVRIEASGAQTVPNGPDNVFEMDTEAYDTGGMYTAPDDFVTIKRAGTYLVTGQVQYNGAASQRQVRIVVDDEIVEIFQDSGADPKLTGQATVLLRLAVGQKVNLGTFSTAAVPVTNFTGLNNVSLTLQWLAP